MAGYRFSCPVCHKPFKHKKGLEWHLYHMEGWKDAQKILRQTTPDNMTKTLMDMDKGKIVQLLEDGQISGADAVELIRQFEV